MATLPGLPMFGHGQVEGYAEKYGMEFRRAYWDERPNEWLVARHEREIFPLLHRRHLFAEVRDFLLYDFLTVEGHVNEDVFAYSNRSGGERALVLYHNRYAEARGWIRESVAYAVKGHGDDHVPARRTLGEGLGLTGDDGHYCAFRDLRTGLEYLRPSRELCERGLYIELGAYRCHVFVDVREVRDDTGLYAELARQLGGDGVPSLDDALRDLALRPVQEPVAALVSGDVLRRLLAARQDAGQAGRAPVADPILDDVERLGRAAIEAAARVSGTWEDAGPVATEMHRRLGVILGLPGLPAADPGSGERGDRPSPAAGEAGEVAPAGEASPAAGHQASADGRTSSGVDGAAAPAGTGGGTPPGVGNASPAAGAGPSGSDAPTGLDAPGSTFLAAAARLRTDFPDDLPTWAVLLDWALLAPLGRAVGTDGRSRSWLDDWNLARYVAEGLRDLGLDEPSVGRVLDTLRIVLALPDPPSLQALAEGAGAAPGVAESRARAWFADPVVSRHLGVNQYGGVTWFDREAFGRLVRWSFLLDVVELRLLLPADESFRAAAAAAFDVAVGLDRVSGESGYRVARLMELVAV